MTSTLVRNGKQTVHESSPTIGERRFGYWAGLLVVVGSMIGTGILTTSGYILRDTGNPAAMLGLWLVGGLLALCGAVTIAELATTLPRSGGDYVFVREAFGRRAGFVSGWATFTLGFAASTALVAHAAMNYLTTPYVGSLGAILPAWAAARVIPIGASLLILGIAAVHTLSHDHSSRLQTVATLVTAAVLVGLAVCGVAFGRGNWSHLSAGTWPNGEHRWALAIGLIYVCYAYTGWNAAGYLAGEVRDPARTLPRCLVGGAITVIVLYLMVNLAYVYALDPVAMTLRSKDDPNVEQVAKLASEHLFGQTAAEVIGAVLGITLVASVSAYLLTGPRVAFAMARDRAFRAFAGRVHPTRGTPAAATLTQAAIAIALVWSGSFLELLNNISVGLAALAGLTVASVFPLRRRRDLSRPYRLPLYPLPPLAYLVLTVWTVSGIVADPGYRIPALLSLATLALGIPLSYVLMDRDPTAKNESDPTNTVTP